MTGRFAGPAVVVAIVALVGSLFLLFRTNFGGPSHNVKPENAPEYARKSGMVESGGKVSRPGGGDPTGAASGYGRVPGFSGDMPGMPGGPGFNGPSGAGPPGGAGR